jgi:hypothetical protein
VVLLYSTPDIAKLGIRLRIIVRTKPRYDFGANERMDLKVRGILQKNQRVRPVDEVGKEAGFKDSRTSLKHVRALAEQTDQAVRRVMGTYVVHPQSMTEQEILRQCENIAWPPKKRAGASSQPTLE